MVEYGRQSARDADRVTDAQYEAVAGRLSPSEVVAPTAVGGLMIATDVVNAALRVALDDSLRPFRKPPA